MKPLATSKFDPADDGRGARGGGGGGGGGGDDDAEQPVRDAEVLCLVASAPELECANSSSPQAITSSPVSRPPTPSRTPSAPARSAAGESYFQVHRQERLQAEPIPRRLRGDARKGDGLQVRGRRQRHRVQEREALHRRGPQPLRGRARGRAGGGEPYDGGRVHSVPQHEVPLDLGRRQVLRRGDGDGRGDFDLDFGFGTASTKTTSTGATTTTGTTAATTTAPRGARGSAGRRAAATPWAIPRAPRTTTMQRLATVQATRMTRRGRRRWRRRRRKGGVARDGEGRPFDLSDEFQSSRQGGALCTSSTASRSSYPTLQRTRIVRRGLKTSAPSRFFWGTNWRR